MAKFPPVDLTVSLDNGGVLNDTKRRIAEWGRLIADYLSPRLGGIREAWADALFQPLSCDDTTAPGLTLYLRADVR